MKKLLSVIFSILLIIPIFSLQSKASTENLLFAGRISTSSGNLNVRSSATTASSIKTVLSKGSLVTVISRSGDFYYVKYATASYGYCHKNYIMNISESIGTVNTLWGKLNVRTGKGTSYSVKDKLSKGEGVIILEDNSSWCRILYHGNKTGYVSSSYLQKNSSQQLKSVKLSVPDFKQTDPRWSYVTLGNSGKTIGKIGCATTCLSMIKSYRLGYYIYPDAMSKQLTYSSSGNLYWPGEYKVNLSKENYLKAFYDSLISGKPVLFGSKNSYGTQHWIVVTGFSGGELSAENFLINDPGSNSRVTLSQFISAYPNFYKYFTY